MGRKMKAAVRASAPRTTRSQTAAAASAVGPLTAHSANRVKSLAASSTAASSTAASSTAASSTASSSSSSPSSSTTPPLPTLFFPSATAWEAWLSAQTSNAPSNHAGIWLKLAKKASGIASVGYDAAVDAALCHGWIDGQRRRCDDARFFLQRFTPRRRRSMWSRRNVARVERLVAEGSMREAGMREVAAARDDGRWERAY